MHVNFQHAATHAHIRPHTSCGMEFTVLELFCNVFNDSMCCIDLIFTSLYESTFDRRFGIELLFIRYRFIYYFAHLHSIHSLYIFYAHVDDPFCVCMFVPLLERLVNQEIERIWCVHFDREIKVKEAHEFTVIIDTCLHSTPL